jgi:hypothetical protein
LIWLPLPYSSNTRMKILEFRMATANLTLCGIHTGKTGQLQIPNAHGS